MTLKDKAYINPKYNVEMILSKDVAEAVKELKEGNKIQLGSLLSSILLWFLSDNIKVDEKRLKRMFEGYLKGGFIDKIFGDFEIKKMPDVLFKPSGSDNQKGCGKWYLKEIEKGLNEPCLCGRHGSCPECQGDVCECGHPGSMHGDNEYTHTGECYFQLNLEKKDAMKMRFCGCRKFKSMKGDGE